MIAGLNTKTSKRQALFVRLRDNGQLYLSKAAADHVGDMVDIYYQDQIVALVSDPLGRYRVSPARSGVQIASKELADWLRERFGARSAERIPAWYSHDGNAPILFLGYPTEQSGAGKARSLSAFQKLDLYYARLGDLYIRDGRGWSYYLSALAAARLGGRVSVYTSGDYLALGPDRAGELPVSGKDPQSRHTIASLTLKKLLQRRFPGVSKLWLIPCGNMLLLSDDPVPPRRKDLPEEGAFRRLELDHHANGGAWAVVDDDRVSMSKAAAATLGELVSIYEAEDAVILINDPTAADAFTVYNGNMKAVLSRELSRILRKKFSIGPSGTIQAKALRGGTALYSQRSGVAIIEPGQLVRLNPALLRPGPPRRRPVKAAMWPSPVAKRGAVRFEERVGRGSKDIQRSVAQDGT